MHRGSSRAAYWLINNYYLLVNYIEGNPSKTIKHKVQAVLYLSIGQVEVQIYLLKSGKDAVPSTILKIAASKENIDA